MLTALRLLRVGDYLGLRLLLISKLGTRNELRIYTYCFRRRKIVQFFQSMTEV